MYLSGFGMKQIGVAHKCEAMIRRQNQQLFFALLVVATLAVLFWILLGNRGEGSDSVAEAAIWKAAKE